MTSLQSIQHNIQPELDKLNALIEGQLMTQNSLMNEVINSYLRRKGKQIRPMVVILVARMFGECNDNSIASSAAVELLHNASLIHDDVVDNSQLRRGVPTINAIWDNHIAVLVGDFFVSTAMQQAISTQNVRIIDALCHLGKILSLGELDQIYNARQHNLSEEAYLRIISHKTASLFVACARMGCYSVNADPADIGKMTRFAELLGLCFQIRDDIFDYFSDDKIGKPTGNDLKEGKITLPLLHVLLDNSLADVETMRTLVAKDNLSDSDISILTHYAVDNGGVDYAYKRMQQMREEAAEILNTFSPSIARDTLLDLFDNVISRDH